ncbi:hypothetical protein OG689_22705 [Kitasatospora sp. NBC_00240]|uniref:DUF3592 domain-containing protein n=1 Tax=Kitasatospora sp. NBC_00240 TaxID=2903567 RepID=UPI002B1D0AEB|nr:DUF3592 domain-containing protein [Kitasatospora sp. NBC_00240]MCX5212056.1 hypothetical protein [Kitasatospora sp. NBC_00240]
METPTGSAAGVVLVLFGGALLFWCAVEMRLRHRVRRHGVPVSARVVADEDLYGALDSAPLLSFATLPSVGAPGVSGASGGAVGSTGRGEVVLARPRGHTPLWRPSGLAIGSDVRVAYDPRRPGLVVLAAGEAGSTLASDVFWTLLGAGSLAGGLALLAFLAGR